MISTKGRYALRVMIDIAIYSNGEYITLKDISKREDISLKYLEQVVILLVRSGMLLSLRGNNGGYRLAKEAKEYTAGDILRVSEGTLATVACLQSPVNNCEKCHTCSTISFWEGFDKVVNDYIDSKTLEDLVNEYQAKMINNYSI